MTFLNDCIIPTWFLVFSSLLILFILYLDRKLKYWKNHGIASPIVGIWTYLSFQYFFLKKPLHENNMENYKKYGRIYGTYLGREMHLVISEPSILKNILVKDFNKFQNRMKLQSGNPKFDKIMSVAVGEDWKRIRCIVSPTFSSSRMRNMAYLVRECAEKFTNYIEKLVEENDTIDCKKYFNNYSVSVIASTAFGTKLDSIDDPDNEFIRTANMMTRTDSNFVMLLLATFPSALRIVISDMFVGKIIRYFHNFALHVIQQRERNKIRGNDFLQLMMDAQRGVLEKADDDIREENEVRKSDSEVLPKHRTMTIEEMLAQVHLFMFAGNETVSITLSFFLYYMSLYPLCQEKLIKEVDETWRKYEKMNFDVLNKMTYLDSALSETLRMMPVAIILTRRCTEEYEIEGTGFKIPKGMLIEVPIYCMQHDPENFPNPELFDPERFMPENRSSIPEYVYLPFGDGPRNCIGMRFAMMVMKMCVAYMFKSFEVHATEETKKPLTIYQGQGHMHPKEIIVKFQRRIF